METKKAISVLVSGASIAGLSTAFWLAKYGFNVTVLERSSRIRAGGQALDVRGAALEVAKRMDILDLIHNNSTQLKGMSMIDISTGEETYRNTEFTFTRGKMDSPDVEILRDDLCRVLLEAVGNKVEYIFDDTIVSINQDETGVDVTFANSASQRFDLVIGADGLRSNVRRLVFGKDEQFIRYLGYYIAIFTMSNIFNLDHWEVFFQHEGIPVSVCIAKDKNSEARAYLGFASEMPLNYDYHDIEFQKRLVTERSPNIGKEMPQIIECMQKADNFYFDGMNQIIMDSWSKGRVILVGDAGHSPSISQGQGTTVAMIGAYVLASELATHKHDLQTALKNYETELREYVEANQRQAYNASTGIQDSFSDPDNMQDLSQSVVPFNLKHYEL